METLDDRLAARVRSADYGHWRSMVHSVHGCAKPIRLSGSHQLLDATNGTVLYHHAGDIFVPCGNRRSSVCPSCSDRYEADAFHLVRAGLIGGTKGVPENVTERARAFVTLTAPSFGPVHTRRITPRGKTRPCGCGDYHHADDPRTATPIDPDTYDYVGSVLWQANAGKLWARFTTHVRRELAKAAGLTVREFADHARLSYGKVAEYQRRGLVHFHAIMRLDGPDGAPTTPPAWATTELLDHAVTVAAAKCSLTEVRPDGDSMAIVWGDQLDVRPVRPTLVDQIEDTDGVISEAKLAAYIAKYATKGTGKSEAADRPIRSQLDIDFARVSEHHRRMIQTAWDLGDLARYDDLNLQRWAHMLGFRGHFLTKSRHYSTTFGAIRQDRRTWRLHDNLIAAELDPSSVAVVNDWNFTGSGYTDDAEQELAAAIADRIRDDRKRKHHNDNNKDTRP